MKYNAKRGLIYNHEHDERFASSMVSKVIILKMSCPKYYKVGKNTTSRFSHVELVNFLREEINIFSIFATCLSFKYK